jgi:hypothetical protein
MSHQALNKSAGAEQSQVHEVDPAPPSSTSSSEKLLRRIASLLFILVAGLLTVFGYYASSLCITVVLAAFLAILFDPVVVPLEKASAPQCCRCNGGARRHGSNRVAGLRALRKNDKLCGRNPCLHREDSANHRTNQQESSTISARCWKSYERRATRQESPRSACRNRQPGLPTWYAEQDLCGEC